METLATRPTEMKTDPLGATLFGLTTAALALAPTQLVVKGLHPAEPLLALAALVWLVRALVTREWRSLPPASHWVVVGSLAVGAFTVDATLNLDIKMDVAKAVLYLLVASTLFRASLTTPQRLRTAVVALLATTTLAVAFAVVQRVSLAHYGQPDPAKRVVFEHKSADAYLHAQTPNYICSTFGGWAEHGYYPSRTAYAGFLALALPFALALLASQGRRWGVSAWLGALLAGAAFSVLAGYVAPVIIAGLLVTGFALGRRQGSLTAVGVLGYLALTIISGNALGGHNREEIIREPFKLRVSQAQANFNPDYQGTRHLKKFFGEQQASLNVVAARRKAKVSDTYLDRALFGVGAGHYQEFIGRSYDLLGAVEHQRLDPDAQSGYLLTAVETGLVGLAALLALLFGYLGDAWRLVRAGRRGNPWAAALLGAVVALTLLCLVTDPFVRGTFVLIAAIFGALGNSATLADAARIEE